MNHLYYGYCMLVSYIDRFPFYLDYVRQNSNQNNHVCLAVIKLGNTGSVYRSKWPLFIGTRRSNKQLKLTSTQPCRHQFLPSAKTMCVVIRVYVNNRKYYLWYCPWINVYVFISLSVYNNTYFNYVSCHAMLSVIYVLPTLHDFI